eukprot:1195840-Prorocentrum_minimum.AAC.9
MQSSKSPAGTTFIVLNPPTSIRAHYLQRIKLFAEGRQRIEVEESSTCKAGGHKGSMWNCARHASKTAPARTEGRKSARRP